MDGLHIALGITATLTTCAAAAFFFDRQWSRVAQFYHDRARELEVKNWCLEEQLYAHQRREHARINQCHEAGRTSAERARERREARTSKTTAALCSAPLRPRDEVVAGVRK